MWVRMLLSVVFCVIAAEVEGETAEAEAPAGANLEDVDPNALLDIDFDDGKFSILSIYWPATKR